MTYEQVKKEYPDISLGTVYRNLGLLCDDGSIIKISVDGADRYDGNAKPHCHFLCRSCKEMSDVHNVSPFSDRLLASVDGEIENYSLTLFGVCGNCK